MNDETRETDMKDDQASSQDVVSGATGDLRTSNGEVVPSRAATSRRGQPRVNSPARRVGAHGRLGCPHSGHPPEDFVYEETVVEQVER